MITFETKLSKYSVLKSVLLYTRCGNWPKPSRLSADLVAFYNQKNSLCVENDVILLQRQGLTRVVIPVLLRDDSLKTLSGWKTKLYLL